MLALSPLRNPAKNEREGDMEGFSMEESEFPDFTSANLLDSIDFVDLFMGISDGDVLPDLEMDPELFAEFSSSSVSAGEESELNFPSISIEKKLEEESCSTEQQLAASVSESGSSSPVHVGGKTMISKKRDERVPVDKGRKSMDHSKNPLGKRKVKVDWTPELHRRFVQAVEQLGVDKAVPSRILELMGMDCLTRHNIASHLQKYRSHRKHLLAREAEAASWSQRRQMYGGATAAGKRDHVNPWIAPTMGFPPVTPMPPPFRPLQVWGHPSVDQTVMHMWPKHLTPPPHAWPPVQPPPPPPPTNPSLWISHQHHVPTPGMPYFPTHLQPARFPTPAVPGIPTPITYKVEQPTVGPVQTVMPDHQPPSDMHPSKESVDTAIGDVLAKPWLPLPLGLKPPSIDSVMGELQRQVISQIPPTCA